MEVGEAGLSLRASPGDVLLDAVETALGAVAADVGEVEGEGPSLRGAVGLGDGDVLHGEGGVIKGAAAQRGPWDKPAAKPRLSMQQDPYSKNMLVFPSTQLGFPGNKIGLY